MRSPGLAVWGSPPPRHISGHCRFGDWSLDTQSVCPPGIRSAVAGDGESTGGMLIINKIIRSPNNVLVVSAVTSTPPCSTLHQSVEESGVLKKNPMTRLPLMASLMTSMSWATSEFEREKRSTVTSISRGREPSLETRDYIRCVDTLSQPVYDEWIIKMSALPRLIRYPYTE